ncbi:FKBP-type peptidyl-prolyl cis-trans isomerase [Candidatus Thiodiazotropha sp. CDECU1]|uniref:FKBP-type peptidyl-prolyl cis-trans isomerase n=1 Tax=Candidatus Thiodiazotropha sp. CDECU1 TaxID=3065865 RepID=UPI00293028DD|nr:FKBP-type peptidyl-prolyl cis-trans isomerase [Candidatus Thiodiazotropha sp. CDECU1]
MRRLNITLFTAALFYSLPSFATELSSDKQQYSYTVGVQIGKMLRAQQTGDLDMQVFLQAVEDSLHNKQLKLDAIQMRAAMKKHYANMETKRAKTAADNKAKAAAYLAQNGKRKNVVTQKSGLQYEVMEPGEGASPESGDSVEVHYHGTLIDGSVFDSSRQRGKPATFNVDRVVPGFSEALLLMKPGAKWRIVIPPELGYGERGAGKKIGPNETLIFELELIKVIEKPSATK